MAQKPNDVVCRRVPISFLDSKQAETVLPRVVETFAKELKWDQKRRDAELKEALEGLQYMK